MNKLAYVLPFVLSVVSACANAGTPLTTIECKSPNASLTGMPYGENYDIKIKIDNALIRYTNACDDTECATKDNYGFVSAVDALYHNVFTMYFENNERNNRGIFYALPATVKYKKTSRGYHAEFKGMYLGDDPRSQAPFKEWVKSPGIEMSCEQKSEL